VQFAFNISIWVLEVRYDALSSDLLFWEIFKFEDPWSGSILQTSSYGWSFWISSQSGTSLLRVLDRVVAPRTAVALLLSLLHSLFRALHLALLLLAQVLALVLHPLIIFALLLAVLLVLLHFALLHLVPLVAVLVLTRCSSRSPPRATIRISPRATARFPPPVTARCCTLHCCSSRSSIRADLIRTATVVIQISFYFYSLSLGNLTQLALGISALATHDTGKRVDQRLGFSFIFLQRTRGHSRYYKEITQFE
jgi:hypothetical protein